MGQTVRRQPGSSAESKGWTSASAPSWTNRKIPAINPRSRGFATGARCSDVVQEPVRRSKQVRTGLGGWRAVTARRGPHRPAREMHGVARRDCEVRALDRTEHVTTEQSTGAPRRPRRSHDAYSSSGARTTAVPVRPARQCRCVSFTSACVRRYGPEQVAFRRIVCVLDDDSPAAFVSRGYVTSRSMTAS